MKKERVKWKEKGEVKCIIDSDLIARLFASLFTCLHNPCSFQGLHDAVLRYTLIQ